MATQKVVIHFTSFSKPWNEFIIQEKMAMVRRIGLADGIMGHIFVSWLHPFKEHRFVIMGSEGMVCFEDSVDGKPLVFYDKKVGWVDGKPVPLSGPTRQIEYDSTLALTKELEYFIDHLNDDPIEIANGDSALQVIQTLEKATASLMEQ